MRVPRSPQLPDAKATVTPTGSATASAASALGAGPRPITVPAFPMPPASGEDAHTSARTPRGIDVDDLWQPPSEPEPASEPRSARAVAPNPDELALAEIVARLRRAMRRAARASDPDNVLSVAQLELLSCLAENPGARPSELARLLRLAPNSVTTLVKGLNGRGLVARGEGEVDRRTVSLTLTAAGGQAVRHWQATNAAILSSALEALHPAWRHLLSAAQPALRVLVESIDAIDPASTHGTGLPEPDADV